METEISIATLRNCVVYFTSGKAHFLIGILGNKRDQVHIFKPYMMINSNSHKNLGFRQVRRALFLSRATFPHSVHLGWFLVVLQVLVHVTSQRKTSLQPHSDIWGWRGKIAHLRGTYNGNGCPPLTTILWHWCIHYVSKLVKLNDLNVCSLLHINYIVINL